MIKLNVQMLIKLKKIYITDFPTLGMKLNKLKINDNKMCFLTKKFQHYLKVIFAVYFYRKLIIFRVTKRKVSNQNSVYFL